MRSRDYKGNTRSALFRLVMALSFSVAVLMAASVVSLMADFDRGRYCEERCTDKFWSCRDRAFNMNDRKVDRAVAICDTTFQSCMGRCMQYAQSKRK